MSPDRTGFIGTRTKKLNYDINFIQELQCRKIICTAIWAVGRSENPGVPELFGGHNVPPLVEIGLNDLPNSGGAMVPPAPPGTTGLAIHTPVTKFKYYNAVAVPEDYVL